MNTLLRLLLLVLPGQGSWLFSAFILGSIFTTCAQGIRGREADSSIVVGVGGVSFPWSQNDKGGQDVMSEAGTMELLMFIDSSKK
jgi:hypothetical protein